MKLLAVLDEAHHQNYIFFSKAKRDQVYKIEELKAHAQNALKQNQVDEALSYASQAAVLYGVSGLVIYQEVVLQYLKTHADKKQPLMILARNAYATQLLLEHLVHADPAAIKTISSQYPHIDFESTPYWESNKSKLIAYGLLNSDDIDYAKALSKDLVKVYEPSVVL